METLLLVPIVIVGTAAPLIVMWALWRGLLGEWEGPRASQRRRGILAGAITAILIVAGTAALIIVDPAGK